MLSDSTILACSPTGTCFHAPPADLWGPDEARASRPVLREREGEVPSRHSPELARPVRECGPKKRTSRKAEIALRSDTHYWASDLLQAEGARVHLVHPLGLHWDTRRVKNDVKDATELANRLRRNDLPEAWVAPPEVRELRELVRYRAKLTALRTSAKAQIHAVMAKLGIIPSLPDMFTLQGQRQLDEMDFPGPYGLRVESLRDLLEIYDRELAMVERRLHLELKDHHGYRVIQGIYGVGQITAAIFVAEIGDVHRFPTARHLCSWAGMTPKLHESDTHSYKGRITKQGSTIVRWAAMECVVRYHGGAQIAPAYRRIAERRGNNIARVAAARKLLTLVFYGLRDGEIRCLNREAA